MGIARMVTDAACFTVSNETYFPGTVALLNSLRLSGNDIDLLVLDRGLSPQQRSRLEAHAKVVQLPLPHGREVADILVKPLARLVQPTGILVIVDSDMIVTASLEPIMALCARGKVCAYRDPQSERWFREWEEIMELQAPVRRQDYVNAGFVALATEQWPYLLPRWWDTSLKAASHSDISTELLDQDALNALLMSEVPREALEIHPEEESPVGRALAHVSIENSQTLICTYKGRLTTLLHDGSGWPKPWDSQGWIRTYRDAYVALLPRLLCGEDVTLRLAPRELPLWLRPQRSGELALSTLHSLNVLTRRLSGPLPREAQRRLRRLRRRLMNRLAS
jgi:hypothetical protein